jgi:hypothetical protein
VNRSCRSACYSARYSQERRYGERGRISAHRRRSERRAWDSNPRGACTPSGFQDRRHRPLGEPSWTSPRVPDAASHTPHGLSHRHAGVDAGPAPARPEDVPTARRLVGSERRSAHPRRQDGARRRARARTRRDRAPASGAPRRATGPDRRANAVLGGRVQGEGGGQGGSTAAPAMTTTAMRRFDMGLRLRSGDERRRFSGLRSARADALSDHPQHHPSGRLRLISRAVARPGRRCASGRPHTWSAAGVRSTCR